MTLTAPDASGVSLRPTASRPVWATYGGGGLTAGGSALLFATVVEWIYYAGGAEDDALSTTYVVAFVAALTLLAASTLPLALGSSGRNGVVGASVLGRVALVAYGWLFLAAQIVLVFANFVASEGDAGSVTAVSLGLTALQSIAAICAVVAIVRARIVRGVARWTFAVSVVAGFVAGALASAQPSLEAVMIGFCVSASSIAFVGLSYVAARGTSAVTA